RARPDWTRSNLITMRAGEVEASRSSLKAKGVSDWQIDSVLALYNVNPNATPDQEVSFRTRKRMVLVMTGGEPMLQDNINGFLERMSQIFEKTQIESNGTQATTIPASTTLVISPKCSEKKDLITGEMVATK